MRLGKISKLDYNGQNYIFVIMLTLFEVDIVVLLLEKIRILQVTRNVQN